MAEGRLTCFSLINKEQIVLRISKHPPWITKSITYGSGCHPQMRKTVYSSVMCFDNKACEWRIKHYNDWSKTQTMVFHLTIYGSKTWHEPKLRQTEVKKASMRTLKQNTDKHSFYTERVGLYNLWHYAELMPNDCLVSLASLCQLTMCVELTCTVTSVMLTHWWT